ncbi:hypothetical protein HDU99_010972 [Rhizoclosmatium hyalinum]|nr:hypothetical protein HDU99_010972 [Rhizoclosmatium hyalinum]
MSKVLIVGGVSGCGKSTVGKELAEMLALSGWQTRFIEGDDLHSTSNKNKMSAGIPLNDDDRKPWLESLAIEIRRNSAELEGTKGLVIASCSSLKKAYRDILREPRNISLQFILLNVDRDELEARMRKRQNHFMPASLLNSQLATLELPDPDIEPDVLIINVRNEDPIKAAAALLR